MRRSDGGRARTLGVVFSWFPAFLLWPRWAGCVAVSVCRQMPRVVSSIASGADELGGNDFARASSLVSDVRSCLFPAVLVFLSTSDAVTPLDQADT